MHKNKTAPQRSIADLLAAQISHDCDAISETAVRSWRQLAAHLTPYIGEAGFCALYGRAIRIAQSDYHWISLPPSSASPRIVFDALAQNLTAMEARIAAQAHAKILEIFTTLLSNLIGEVLTTQILNSAWACESDGKNTEEKSK